MGSGEEASAVCAPVLREAGSGFFWEPACVFISSLPVPTPEQGPGALLLFSS